MTFLEKLQAHKGGIIRLKTQLFWYSRGHDNNPGRICLVLDAATPAAAAAAAVGWGGVPAAVALLLIDGSPQWIWVAEEDVEVLDEAG